MGKGKKSNAKTENTPHVNSPKQDTMSEVPATSPVKKTGSQSTKSAAPKHQKMEFGGPFGTTMCVIFLPLVIYSLFFLCNSEVCLSFDIMGFDWKKWLHELPSVKSLFTLPSILMYVGWMSFHVILERILPGELVEGALLKNGKRLPYVMSGHLQFWLTLVAVGYGVPYFVSNEGILSLGGLGSLPIDLIYDHYVGLCSISIVGATVLSIYL